MSNEDEDSSRANPPPQSQDGELPLNPDGSIDVDRVRIKLLIICRTKKTLEPIATYLSRRGWETVVSAELKESFKLVTVFKPDFVLVSVNVQSPKLASLPTVISQTFRVPAITFGEGSDTRTLMNLQTINSPFKMNGVVSGPSAHRRVKQILQEMYKPETESPRDENVANEQSDKTVISGKAKTKTLSGFMRFSNDKKESGPGIIISKAEPGKVSGGNFDIDALAAEFAAESDAPAPATEAPAFSVATNRDGGGPAAISADKHGDSHEMFGLDPGNHAQYENTIRNEEALIQSLFGESKVNQALKVIALKSAQPLELGDEITVLEECTIIPLKILRKTAYLIVVVAGTAQDEITYLQKFLSNLRHDLTANFEMVSVLEETRMGVKIDFDHLDKSDEAKGTFIFSLKTGRGYASMLLVYENAFNVTVYEEESSPKARININELIPGIPVGVDIFLHLPKNDKDYLYLRPASAISEAQKERLVTKDAKLFVDKKDIAAYKGAVRRNMTLESRVLHKNAKRKSA